jgi:hypothetical protein
METVRHLHRLRCPYGGEVEPWLEDLTPRDGSTANEVDMAIASWAKGAVENDPHFAETTEAIVREMVEKVSQIREVAEAEGEEPWGADDDAFGLCSFNDGGGAKSAPHSEEAQMAFFEELAAMHILVQIFKGNADAFVEWCQDHPKDAVAARQLPRAFARQEELAEDPDVLVQILQWVRATRDLLALGWAV